MKYVRANGSVFEIWKSLMASKIRHINFDYKEMPTYEGHITIDSFNCLCGYEYVYYGILNRRERLMFPRAKNNYLKFIPLKDVECEKCKELKYKELSALENEKPTII